MKKEPTDLDPAPSDDIDAPTEHLEPLSGVALDKELHALFGTDDEAEGRSRRRGRSIPNDSLSIYRRSRRRRGSRKHSYSSDRRRRRFRSSHINSNSSGRRSDTASSYHSAVAAPSSRDAHGSQDAQAANSADAHGSHHAPAASSWDAHGSQRAPADQWYNGWDYDDSNERFYTAPKEPDVWTPLHGWGLYCFYNWRNADEWPEQDIGSLLTYRCHVCRMSHLWAY